MCHCHRQGQKGEEPEIEDRYPSLCLSIHLVILGLNCFFVLPELIDVATGEDEDHEQERVPGLNEE